MRKWSLYLLLVAFLGLPFFAYAIITATLNYEIVENLGAATDEFHGIAIDGSYLYLSGVDSVQGGYTEWRFEKRNLSDGSLVYATTSNPTVGYHGLLGSLVISDSYMYGAGYNYLSGSDYVGRIEKRNLSDGSLVYATTSNPSAGYDPMRDLAVADSYIYTFGDDVALGNAQWHIEKRNASDGSLVYATTSNPSSGADNGNFIAIDGSYMYLAGADAVPGNNEWRIEKRNISDGSLVYATTSNPSSGDDSLSFSGGDGLVIDGAYMYLVGSDFSPGNRQFRIEKRNTSDGSLVYATTSNPTAASDFLTAMILKDDYMYVLGYERFPGGSDYQWRIEKRNTSDGSLVYTQAYNPAAGFESPLAVAFTTTTLYAAGYDWISGSDYQSRLATFIIDPTPTISSLSPVSYSKTAGDGAFTLTVNGTYFSTDSVVRWNGSDRVTSYVSPTQVTASILAADIATAGTYSVTVKENTSDGNESVPASYVVDVVRVGGGGGGGIGYGGSSSPAPVISPVITPVTPQPPVSVVSPILHFRFDKNLKLGTTHSDVQELQKFLNAHGFSVALSGPGSSGNESSYFGLKTKQALVEFQEANRDEILKPNGLIKGTGIFGPSTRAVMNRLGL